MFASQVDTSWALASSSELFDPVNDAPNNGTNLAECQNLHHLNYTSQFMTHLKSSSFHVPMKVVAERNRILIF